MINLIRNINNVLPYVDASLHKIVQKDDHIVIGYHFMTPETFRDPATGAICPIRSEFRGLTFCRHTGEILRRPFHKFFNYGENETATLDWDSPLVVMDKMDGSLVSPFFTTSGRLVWGTKSAETDMSADIKPIIERLPYYQGIVSLIEDFSDMNALLSDERHSLLFEFVSPNNKIVLDYDEPKLVLLGIRNNITGEYVQQSWINRVVPKMYGIPIVASESHDSMNSESFLATVREYEDVEGVVVRQGNHFVKIKCDWYVRLHKNKELISYEKNVVELIVNGQLDDVIPLLQEMESERLQDYASKFMSAIDQSAHKLARQMATLRREHTTRRDMGIYLKNADRNPIEAKMVWLTWDDRTVDHIRELLIDMFKNSVNTGTKLETLKQSMTDFSDFPDWTYNMLGEE